MKLAKSYAELDVLADQILAKSQAAADEKAPEDEKLNPADISSEAAPAPKSEDADEDEADSDESEDEKKDEKPDEETVSKSMNDEDSEPDDDDDADEGDADDEYAEPNKADAKTPDEMEKSFREDFIADDTIGDGVQGSEFFSAMVDVLAKSLGDMQYDANQSRKYSEQNSVVLAKSMQAMMLSNKALADDNARLTRRINKLEKSINMGFEKVMDSLDAISSQPAHMRKSLSSVQVRDRDFGSSLNGAPTKVGFESLNKSQVLNILNGELYSGNPNVTAQDIIGYESGAPLRPDLQEFVASKYNK